MRRLLAIVVHNWPLKVAAVGLAMLLYVGLVFAQNSREWRGQVPIEIRNLPHGVKVMDIGLNGVLITESETSRQFTLEAEPWVKPQERPIYAVATIESDPASFIASSPIVLGVGVRP